MSGLLIIGGEIVVKGNSLVAVDRPEDCDCCNDCDVSSGGMDVPLARCARVDVIETITNGFAKPALLTITGGVDDDVIINGVIYEDNQHPFFGNPNPCGRPNTNGAHNFLFSQTLAPGQSVTIGGQDNAFGGWLTYTWKIETCPSTASTIKVAHYDHYPTQQELARETARLQHALGHNPLP